MQKCQQVINDITKELCGAPGELRPSLFAILCDEHYEYAKDALHKLWGIAPSNKTLKQNATHNHDLQYNPESGLVECTKCGFALPPRSA